MQAHLGQLRPTKFIINLFFINLGQPSLLSTDSIDMQYCINCKKYAVQTKSRKLEYLQVIIFLNFSAAVANTGGN